MVSFYNVAINETKIQIHRIQWKSQKSKKKIWQNVQSRMSSYHLNHIIILWKFSLVQHRILYHHWLFAKQNAQCTLCAGHRTRLVFFFPNIENTIAVAVARICLAVCAHTMSMFFFQWFVFRFEYAEFILLFTMHIRGSIMNNMKCTICVCLYVHLEAKIIIIA